MSPESCEHHCMGVDECDICGEDDEREEGGEDAYVGYDCEGSPIGG